MNSGTQNNLPLARRLGRDSLQSRESGTENQKQETSMRMEENKNRKTRKGVGRKPKTDPAVYRYVVLSLIHISEPTRPY